MLASLFSLLIASSVAVTISASPLQTRQSCTSSYTVVSGDTCNLIVAKTGVALATLYELNPAVNSGCTNLAIGEVLCLSESGAATTTSTASGSTGTAGSTFNGIATYYDPNGGYGACGNILENTDAVVALGPATWDGGAHCGETVSVTYGTVTVDVVVADLCPGCQGTYGIDLTEPPMSQLDAAYVFDGHINVVWGFVN
uniref:Non-Catalytic module family EXPN protein n=1 Tax=Mycena chlorophos TaxID=658473 RepID=A0ABQ0LJF4_MYCCL|nr:non-Catalytic module family EXPN protein [Mycena chlorophos]